MSAAANRRVLIVDDTPAIHADFRKILAPDAPADPGLSAMEAALFGDDAATDDGTALELESAHQGQEALAMVEAALAAGRPYAMAFVDMRMPPGWDGVETIERLWAVDPLLQVVICTAYSDHSWDSVLARLDVRDRLLVLKKPFDAIEVSQLARSLTAKWQRNADLAASLSALASKEAEIRAVVEHMADGLLTLDDAGTVRSANPMVEAIFGLPAADAIGRDIARLVPELGGAAADAWSAGDGRPTRQARGLHRDGRDIALEVALSDHRIGGQRRRTVILRDIGERVATMKALEQARHDAEQASRAKSAFVATMSHELRTPMNGVIGMIGVLEHSALDAEQSRMVGLARESAVSLLEIIDDILDFSKIEAGRLELEREPVSVKAIVAKASALVVGMATSKQVGIETQVDPALPASVRGDALRLRQVLVNLLSNAIKFSSGRAERGRVRLEATATRTSTTTATIELAVHDNGIGMDAATVAGLFRPFSQADATMSRRFGGSGLGLAITRGFVDSMGGEILVRSMPGAGSVFTVRLPVELVDGAAPALVPTPVPTPSPSAAVPPPAKDGDDVILVAEDNAINQQVILSQLKLLGHKAAVANDGSEALAAWRTGRYAMLLTDLQMPRMDGFALARAIRAEEAPGRRMPIVALTANALGEEATRCLEVGMDDYVPKPVQLAGLRSMLDRHLGRGTAPAGLVAPTVATAAPTAGSTPTPASNAPVDPRSLVALIGDDPATIREFLADFSIAATDTAAEMRKAVRDGRHDLVGASAHRLKASSAAVGAQALSALCAEIEAAARDAPDALARLLPLFESEVPRVRDWIARDAAAASDTRAPSLA